MHLEVSSFSCSKLEKGDPKFANLGGLGVIIGPQDHWT